MSDTVLRQGSFTRSFNGNERDSTQPRFHIEPVLDDLASANAGRPIYREEERVQYLQPASLNQPVFRVTDEHRQRWPEVYAAFKAGLDMAVNGTPLEQWPPLSKAMVLEMKALGIYSVEQLADMSDTALQRVGRGSYNLRERARAYLEEGEAGALTERLNRENELLTAKVAATDRELAELRDIVNRMHRESMAKANEPHPLATNLPSANYASTAQIASGEAAATSSLDRMPALRGRPRKDAAA